MKTRTAIAHILRRLKRDLPKNLTYHNYAHALSTMSAAADLAEDEGASGRERALIAIAAAYHDAGFLFRYWDNESMAAELVEKDLPAFGCSPPDIQRIAAMILATRLPQAPKNAVERILCDADLSYLGNDDSETGAERLRRELAVQGKTFQRETDWWAFQIAFLEKHHYFTAAARKRYDKKKQRYLDSLREKLAAAQK